MLENDSLAHVLYWIGSMIHVSSFLLAGISSEHSPAEKVVSIMSEIRALQEIIGKFKALQVDPTEYACLKGIVIFKTGV